MKVSQIPLPKEKKKKDVFHRVDLYRVVYIKGDKLLVIKRGKDQWLSGQFEVPTLFKYSSTLPSMNTKKLETEYFRLQQSYPSSSQYKTGITQYRFTNKVIAISNKSEIPKEVDMKNVEWVAIDKNSNFTRATLKALESL
jgi:adenine-specific DNA glycosylase